jgi:predicted Zn-dependent protease
VVAFATVGAPAPADAQKKHVISVRDAEIESIIQKFATPLFRAAGLNADAIRVYLVQDPTLNAFVAGGQNMFIHTGLLMAAQTPNQLIGVIAHETGHIAGGHLARLQNQMRDANLQNLLTTVLGIGAAVATGRPELATAIMAGGSDIALKNLLGYSRTQESSADLAATKYLERTGQSTKGLRDFLRLLEDRSILTSRSQDPYLLTHPLTGERLAYLDNFISHSKYSNVKDTPENKAAFARMKAKLIGYLMPEARVLQIYPPNDASLPARYARAYLFYRRGELVRALAGAESLLADEPNDPFFNEFKGDILMNGGHIRQAADSYQRAVDLLPGNALLHRGLAQALVELNDPAADAKALPHVRMVLRDEPNSPMVWRLAAIIYGRQGNMGESSLALAEAALARGDLKEARQQANRAQHILATGSAGWLRAQDIDREAERLQEEH